MLNRKGVTLIELLVALVISSILVAAIYQTFVSHQHTYTVQGQVTDMQQNVRVAINQMIREIRTAGSGSVRMTVSFDVGGVTRTYANIINKDLPAAGDLTIVSAAIRTPATLTAKPGDIVGGNILASNQIQVSDLTELNINDNPNRRYISVGGRECFTITAINDVPNRILTLNGTPSGTHKTDGQTPVHPIRAVSYRVVPEGGTFTLKRDENLGGGFQALSDNIETLGLRCFNAGGAEIDCAANPADITRIRLTVTARSPQADPEYKSGDGYRRRTVMSNIQLRNAGL